MEISWGYVAGFFDGEGYLGIILRKESRGIGIPKAVFAQSGERGERILTEIAGFLHSYDIHSYMISSHDKRNPRAQQQWRLQISGRPNVLLFVRAILPYLRVKKVEAQDLLRFLTVFGSLQKLGVKYGKTG